MRVALMCSGVSMIGWTSMACSAGPTFVPAGAWARIACTARPCASTAWWRNRASDQTPLPLFSKPHLA
jgi:hypothetical protein